MTDPTFVSGYALEEGESRGELQGGFPDVAAVPASAPRPPAGPAFTGKATGAAAKTKPAWAFVSGSSAKRSKQPGEPRTTRVA